MNYKNVTWDSLQPLRRLLGRGQRVGAVPLQSHLGLGVHQPSLEVGVQLLSQLLQGHRVLVLVGALLRIQLGRSRHLIFFLGALLLQRVLQSSSSS